jgi:superfamily II DNA/RNA helicase
MDSHKYDAFNEKEVDEPETIAKDKLTLLDEYKLETFEALEIDAQYLRGIYSCGFEQPSAIQKLSILPIVKGRDVIAQAQSGTGKTASFCIGGISRVDTDVEYTQLLILSPTRELAIQTSSVISNIATFKSNLRIKTVIGGNLVQDDIADLKANKYHVIVGCPGRVTDIIQRKAFDALEIKTIILDEADEMLNSGFQEQICKLFKFLNAEVQVVLFSATMPRETMEITKKFMRNPYIISVEKDKLSLDGIEQQFIALETDNDKYETLTALFKKIDISQCIIYANSVDRVKHLTTILSRDGFSVNEMHSELSRHDREACIRNFKAGQFRILISTDLTARGIDVQQVSLVINFDIPRDEHIYLHRIGRSGRWGRKGQAINLVGRRDIYTMEKIEKHYQKTITEYVF